MAIVDTKQLNIPSDPATIKKISDAMKECSASYVRMEGEKDFLKELFTELAKDTELPAAYLRKISRIYHAQNVAELAVDNENIIELYEKIFGTGE